MTALLDRILELDQAATPEGWEVVTVKTSCGVCHKVGTHEEVTAERAKSLICLYDNWPASKETHQLARADLIATYRTAAPALARALKIAVEALDSVSKASVMHSRDAGDCIIDRHKDDAGDALAAIAKELEGVQG